MAMLEVKNITHSYTSSTWFRKSLSNKNVINNVSLQIEQGTCMGLLGSSGAGKSTLGKIILGMERPKQGQVFFQGQDVYALNSKLGRQWRRDLQVVFQDCYSAVNPKMTAEQIIGEPLHNYEITTMKEQKRYIGELLECVGLQATDGSKYPHQFSGGQLQRINIARAIALKPKLIVLDEALSSLDMVTQSQILKLLQDLRMKFGLSYLFITHDIKAAFTISDTLAVMQNGQIVEHCNDKEQFLQSSHPAVKSLLDCMVSEHPRERLKKNAST
jgi:nickel transport system ATP-binding protein